MVGEGPTSTTKPTEERTENAMAIETVRPDGKREVVFGHRFWELVNQAGAINGADSATEVIGQAVMLYHALLVAQRDGGMVLVRDRDHNDRVVPIV